MARIGIAGAGLLGRLLAWRLSPHHEVTVFDPADGPQGRISLREGGKNRDFEYEYEYENE